MYNNYSCHWPFCDSHAQRGGGRIIIVGWKAFHCERPFAFCGPDTFSGRGRFSVISRPLRCEAYMLSTCCIQDICISIFRRAAFTCICILGRVKVFDKSCACSHVSVSIHTCNMNHVWWHWNGQSGGRGCILRSWTKSQCNKLVYIKSQYHYFILTTKPRCPNVL